MDESAVRVTRRQVVHFRLARHNLAQRLGPGGTPAAAWVGLQDTPPGSAAVALAARADVAPEALDELVLVPSIRGAPLAVAERDLGVFTAGLEPPDEEAARAVVGSACKALDGITAMEALDRVSEAVHESLRDGPRPRDDFHQALRERLPAELLWWCKGCGSRHVHPSLWRATGIRGVLAIVGREGRSAVFGLPPKAPALNDPGAELARRFLRAYGPARPGLLAAWAGLAPTHAAALWERTGALVCVDIEGTKGWALAEDEPVLHDPPPPRGVRLLANLDPLHAGRDRELLVPEPALRKRIWTALGGPGTVLVAGEVAALWRPTRKGRKLLVTAEPLGDLTAAAKEELAAEAARIAPFRGAEAGALRVAAV
ncbi:MAG TPA: crosslink repair DNA glycosylase YcaQ family protein [Solirubrobacteraceae bacterium]|nr:crosslink repair DNA glycosylase YcaQ family protein [Solirubrobacteraceae bacterium]